jgi:outer membrane protein
MKNFKLILLTFLSAAFVFGQTQITLSLDEALSLIAKNNIIIQKSKNNMNISNNNVNFANSGLLPRLDFNSSMNYTDALSQMPGTSGNTQNTSISNGANLSYTIFNGLKGVNTYRLLKVQAKNVKLQHEILIENTLYNSSLLFFNLLMSYDNLNILKEQLDISKERLKQIRDKNDLGIASQLQTLAAQVDFDSDSSSVIESEFLFEDNIRKLNLILGWDLTHKYIPVLDEYDFSTYNLSELQEQVLQKNKNLIVNQNLKTKSELDLKMAKGSLLPTISANVNYGLSQTNSDVDFGFDDPNLSISSGLNFSWNIFDGRGKNNVQNAKSQLRNSELSIIDSEREMINEIESAYQSFIKSLKILDLKKNNLNSAQLNFDQTNELYRLGTVTSTQFRESQLNLSRVKNSMSSAKYSAYLGEIKIWLLIGQIENKLLSE